MLTDKNNQYSRSYLVLAAIFIGALITSNIISVKLLSIAGLFVPAGIIIFPVTYIIGDVVAEVYGFEKARQMILLAFLGNLLSVVFIGIAILLPAAPFWNDQNSYQLILGNSWRLLTASFIAFLVGSITNAWILSQIKIITKGKYLWLRTTVSTFVGEGLDTLIFLTIAFALVVGLADLLKMMFSLWAFKVGFEILIIPLTYTLVAYLKKEEGIDEKIN